MRRLFYGLITVFVQNACMRSLRNAGKDIGRIRRDDVGIVPYESEFVGVAFSKTAS